MCFQVVEMSGGRGRLVAICGAPAFALATRRPLPAFSPATLTQLTPHPLSQLVDHAIGRERRAFLPADEVAGVVAGKVHAPVGRLQSGERLLVVPCKADPGAEIVRDLSPTHINRFCQILAVTGMEQLNRSARGVELGLHRRQMSECIALDRWLAVQPLGFAENVGKRARGRSVFSRVAADDDAFL